MTKGKASSDGRVSGRSKPRASLACINCRQRKIKCNVTKSGAGSSCSACRSMQVPCVLSRDGDRRKAGSRAEVAALQDRLQSLERLIARTYKHDFDDDDLEVLGSENSDSSLTKARSDRLSRETNDGEKTQHRGGLRSSDAEVAVDLASVWEASSETRSCVVTPTNEASSGAPLNIEPLLRTDKRAVMSSPDEITRSPKPPHCMSQVRDYCPQVRLTSSEFTAAKASDMNNAILTPSSEKDGGRLDFHGSHGRPTFYGPTSQLYIQRRGKSIVEDDQESRSQRRALLKMDSAPLRAHLLHVWWNIQPNSVVIVDETNFQKGRVTRTRNEYYSDFLENSLLACATRMSTSENVRALGCRYVERAKLEIASELEDPSIATLQGFLLLSDFEATRGRDRLGYMYCGIACRLAFDLGLSESCSDLVAKGRLTSFDSMMRHTLFLDTFIFDKLWSLYLGRPSSIPLPLLETAHTRSKSMGWSGSLTLEPWVGLCTDISEVTDILNSASPMNSTAQEQLDGLDARIHQRHQTLPSSLKIPDGEIAELPVTAYGLHIQFYGIRIVLHRLLSKSLFREPPDGDSINSNSSRDRRLERSRIIMYESATRIARLVSIYQEICGVENVITVMLDNVYISAAVLISHLLRPAMQDVAAPSRQDYQWLRSCANLMKNAQKHYPVAARMRSTLSSLVEGTLLEGTFGNFKTVDESASSASAATDATDLVTFSGDEKIGSQSNPGIFDRCFTESMEQVYDMDLRNMMSWVFSPGEPEDD